MSKSHKNKYLFILLLIISFNISCNSKIKLITYNSIGYFSTNYNLKTGAPRQGMLENDIQSLIILDKKYSKGLKDLDNFEYIYVIYHFNKAKGWENIVKPPESEHSFGVFATRSPRRPNPIALSLVKLDSVKGNILYIKNADAFDKTPVIDIKPFLPSIDKAASIKNLEAELLLGHHSSDFLNDSLIKIFIEGESKQNKNK